MAFGMNFFRKHQGRLLIVLASTLMLTWFVGTALVQMFSPKPTAGSIFGEAVSLQAYGEAQTALAFFDPQRRPTEQEVWKFLVLQHEADRLGITVSEAEVTNAIRQWVQAVTGADESNLDNAYRQLLYQLRTSHEHASFVIAKHLRLDKLRSMIAGAAAPTDAEAWMFYVQDRVQLKLKTLRISTAACMAKVAPADDAILTAYYDTHKAAYLEPAAATVEYVTAAVKDYETLFSVSDEEVQDYYDTNKVEEFLKPAEQPEEIASTDSSMESADDAIASTDAVMESAEAVAATDSIIADQDIYKPLEEVAGEIRAKLLARKAAGAMTDVQVDGQQSKDAQIRPLSQIADLYGLPYSKVGPFTETEKTAIPGLAEATGSDKTPVMTEIFTRKPTELQYAEGPDGIYVYRVTESTEPRQPDFEEIKARLAADYVKTEAERMALEQAGTVLADLTANGWAAYEKDPAYDVIESPLGQTAKFPALFYTAAVVEKSAFGGPVLGPDGAYDFQVIDRVEPAIGAFESMKGLVKAWGFRQETQKFIESWEADLVSRANVEIRAPSTQPEEPAPIDSLY